MQSIGKMPLTETSQELLNLIILLMPLADRASWHRNISSTREIIQVSRMLHPGDIGKVLGYTVRERVGMFLFSIALMDIMNQLYRLLADESGWNWFIPLHNGLTSVGVVMNEEASKQRKQATKRENGGVAPTAKQHYLHCLQLSPRLIELLGDAKLCEDGPYPVVQSASDYSYNAPTYSGDHYRLIGDAAGKRTPVSAAVWFI